MPRFEVVSKYKDADIHLPSRGTMYSAGYDFEVAEDTIIPSYSDLLDQLFESAEYMEYKTYTFEEISDLTKSTKLRPTLVPTGVKCQLNHDQYLELSVRSSCPLKSWLILANGVGIIDSDYYNNLDNEGHIYFQIINLGPRPILLHKGDKIGQGIIKRYEITDDDKASGERMGGFGSTSNHLDCEHHEELQP